MGAKLVEFQSPDNNLVELLREMFEINLHHYRLMQSCSRTKENPFGLRCDQATPEQRKTLKQLEQKTYVEYNERTECYELGGLGEYCIEWAPRLAQHLNNSRHKTAQVLSFPAS